MTTTPFAILLAILLTLGSLFCGNAKQDSAAITQPAINEDSIRPTAAIAYIRNGAEIRLVNKDGTNDRQLWTHPDAKEPLGLFDVAWRPDGKELAFTSAHEAVSSLYHADIYSIRPDGSGFRKITNAPGTKDFSKFKTGTVTLTVRNNQYTFQQANSSSGIFIVNVVGAAEPQQITLPPGSSKTIIFKNVADFGNRAQAVVAMMGNFRWFMPGTDVRAGMNVKAPDLIISGDGIELFGAFRPTWRQDGSAISYRSGLCVISEIPVQPAADDPTGKLLFSEDGQPDGGCTWDWGPTVEQANQLIYTNNTDAEGSAIYLLNKGETLPGKKLTHFSDIQYQLLGDLRWLPDGSGFLYSATSLYLDNQNIFRYDISTNKTTQVTQLQSEFARRFTISPDGHWIVFERAGSANDFENVDLWIVKTDGSESRLLVKNGWCPSWSR